MLITCTVVTPKSKVRAMPDNLYEGNYIEEINEHMNEADIQIIGDYELTTSYDATIGLPEESVAEPASKLTEEMTAKEVKEIEKEQASFEKETKLEFDKATNKASLDEAKLTKKSNSDQMKTLIISPEKFDEYMQLENVKKIDKALDKGYVVFFLLEEQWQANMAFERVAGETVVSKISGEENPDVQDMADIKSENPDDEINTLACYITKNAVGQYVTSTMFVPKENTQSFCDSFMLREAWFNRNNYTYTLTDEYHMTDEVRNALNNASNSLSASALSVSGGYGWKSLTWVQNIIAINTVANNTYDPASGAVNAGNTVHSVYFETQQYLYASGNDGYKYYCCLINAHIFPNDSFAPGTYLYKDDQFKNFVAQANYTSNPRFDTKYSGAFVSSEPSSQPSSQSYTIGGNISMNSAGLVTTGLSFSQTYTIKDLKTSILTTSTGGMDLYFKYLWSHTSTPDMRRQNCWGLESTSALYTKGALGTDYSRHNHELMVGVVHRTPKSQATFGFMTWRNVVFSYSDYDRNARPSAQYTQIQYLTTPVCNN